jgi:hypothetical protein
MRHIDGTRNSELLCYITVVESENMKNKAKILVIFK